MLSLRTMGRLEKTLSSFCQRSLWKQKGRFVLLRYIRNTKKCFIQPKLLLSPCVPSSFTPSSSLFPQQVHIARSSVEPKQTQQSSYPGAPPLLLRLAKLANSNCGQRSLFICFLKAEDFFPCPSIYVHSLLCWSSFFYSLYDILSL